MVNLFVQIATCFLVLAKQLVLYINGKMAAQDTTAGSNSASQTRHPNLILGAGTLISLINDYWNMQLDDLAIWEDHLLTAEEVVHVMNKGKKAAVSPRVFREQGDMAKNGTGTREQLRFSAWNMGALVLV